jgi:hypothetical protein
MPGLGQQSHGGLKEIDIETEDKIYAIQSLQGCSGRITIIAHQSPDHRPVLLLYMAAIIFLVGARASEGNTFPLAIGKEVMINEFAAIVRVHA